MYTEPMILAQDRDDTIIIEKPYPKKNIIHTVNDFVVVHQVVFLNDVEYDFTPFFTVLHIPSAKRLPVLFKKKHFAIRYMELFEAYVAQSSTPDIYQDAHMHALMNYTRK